MSGYMLDTNVASHVVRGDQPAITRKLLSLPMEDIVISAITEGELLYGIARRNWPKALTERVQQFLLRVDVLPWDHEVADHYGRFRAMCEAQGLALSSLDMMIAAHAVAAEVTLVTRDKALRRLPPPLATEDWLS